MVQHMSKSTDKVKNVSFGAVIPAEYAEELTEFQWNNRLTRPQLVRAAIDAFADANGITRPADDSAETPAK